MTPLGLWLEGPHLIGWRQGQYDAAEPGVMQLVGCLHPEPYPRPDPRLEPEQPARTLPVPADHLGELPHDSHPLLLVHQLKEVAFDPLAGIVPEQLTSPLGKVLDLSVRAQDNLRVVRESAPLHGMAIGGRAIGMVVADRLSH